VDGQSPVTTTLDIIFNLPALQQIAQATGGKEYPGTPQSIDLVYTQILQQNV